MHFHQLYNYVACDVDKLILCNPLSTVPDGQFYLCVNDVVNAIRKQKLGKSSGPDGIQIGIAISVFVYGGIMLCHPRLASAMEQNRVEFCHHSCLMCIYGT